MTVAPRKDLGETLSREKVLKINARIRRPHAFQAEKYDLPLVR